MQLNMSDTMKMNGKNACVMNIPKAGYNNNLLSVTNKKSGISFLASLQLLML